MYIHPPPFLLQLALWPPWKTTCFPILLFVCSSYSACLCLSVVDNISPCPANDHIWACVVQDSSVWFAQVGGYGSGAPQLLSKRWRMCECDIMSSCQSALSHMQILVLVFLKFLCLVKYASATPRFHQALPLFSLFSHTGHTPSCFFFFLNKQSHMCVGHSFDRHTGTDAAFAGFILPVKWRCNSPSTKQWHHHVSLFLFAQSNEGETVSHMSRSLHLNFNACVFFICTY